MIEQIPGGNMSAAGAVGKEGAHAAGAAALGFYYQTLFALVTLIAQITDNAAVVVERLDDVELNVDGNTMLYQLKHSMGETPPPITLYSRSLWKTIKVWIDAMPDLTLSETTLCLVAVGKVPDESPLKALLVEDSDRAELLKAMQEEAKRVVDERCAAKQIGKKIPHEDRAAGCEAFLALGAADQQNILRRIRIQQGSPTIDKIEGAVATHLMLLPEEHRPVIAKRLIEWWDRQVIYSLCGKRERVLTRVELQHQITTIIGDIEQARLVPDFMTTVPPKEYQPDGMLTRQVQLVDGRESDLTVAIRDEWRAREQRSRWLNANPAMASTINDYDIVLQEKWSDRHMQMADECSELEDKGKRESGLKLLRWAHQEAPGSVPPLSQGWSGHYYVSGTYHVLAIDLKVGWHPDYRDLLKEGE